MPGVCDDATLLWRVLVMCHSHEGGERVSEGVSKGVSEGVSKGVSKGVNEGVSKGVNEGVSKGVNEGVSKGVSERVNEYDNWLSKLFNKLPLHSRYFPIIFLIFSCYLVEISSIFIMKVISGFYFAISTQNFHLFLLCLWKSLFVITIVSILISIKSFAIDYIAMKWRQNLVLLLHIQMNWNDKWTLIVSQKIENIDQRVTQDVYRLTQKLAIVLGNLITAPAIIIFYSYYLIDLFGVIVPLACVLYFVVGAIMTHFQAKKIVPIVYVQEQEEGYFRFKHMHYRAHLESIVFLNGNNTELQFLNKSFDSLIKIVNQLIFTQLPLNLIVNWLSYFGSIGK